MHQILYPEAARRSRLQWIVKVYLQSQSQLTWTILKVMKFLRMILQAAQFLKSTLLIMVAMGVVLRMDPIRVVPRDDGMLVHQWSSFCDKQVLISSIII